MEDTILENNLNVIKWNIFRFIETLLPIIHKNKNVSIELLNLC